MKNFFSKPTDSSGFTLVEIVVVIGIMALLIGAITEIFLISNRSKNIIFDQLSVQGDGRRAVDRFMNEVRRATYSGIGAYPIEYADSQQFIFFTNADGDTDRERVRYFLSGTTLQRGVIQPMGTPITYPAGTEVVTEVARALGNGATPLFYYYDQTYNGSTNNYLPVPIDIGEVRVVGIKLVFDEDPAALPLPFTIESKTEIRNLKSN